MSQQIIEKRSLSVEKPWMKFYPEQLQHMEIPNCSLYQYLKQSSRNLDDIVIEYYGNYLTLRDIFVDVDRVAKAMKQLGCSEGDQIPVFLQSVPEFVIILLAAEKIGAAVVCRDGLPEENASAVNSSHSKILFAHDYLSKMEEELYYKDTNLRHIIKVSPYNMARKSKMPGHIVENIESKYIEEPFYQSTDFTWEAFKSIGDTYEGEYEAEVDPSRAVFCAYTSGTTGPSKQVIHTAASIVGMMHQTAVFTAGIDFRLTWLTTCLPPALVAATVSMILTPLASNKLLYLDPFSRVSDLDLELMRYNPNCWALIPQFTEVLVNSTRIPEDFSLEQLYCVGSGAESLNNKQIRRIQDFLQAHKCNAYFSVGYGMSEGGSGFTIPCEGRSLNNCCCGIPMPATTIGIFDSATNEEVAPGTIGEICKSGAGIMLSFQDAESTKKVLKRHEDGEIWIHSGDYGYMTEEGILYVMGRGLLKRATGGYLFVVPMENKVVNLDGVKDAFFVTVPDRENEGFYLPYLYLVLEKGTSLEEVRESITNALEPHERPVAITVIEKRPYYHFKTNRRGLQEKILQSGVDE